MLYAIFIRLGECFGQYMTPFDDKIHVHILTKINVMFLHKYSFKITVNPGAYVWDHVKNVLLLGSVPLLTRASNIIRTVEGITLPVLLVAYFLTLTDSKN